MEDEITTTTNDDQPAVDVGTDSSEDEDELTDTLDAFEREALVKFVVILGGIIGLNAYAASLPATPIVAIAIGLLTGLSGRFDGYVSSLVGGGAGAAVAVLLTSFVGVLVTLGGSLVLWTAVGAATALLGTFVGAKVRDRLV